MWLFDKGRENDNPCSSVLLQHITQLSYMTCPLPWRPYPHYHEDEFEVTMLESGCFTLELPGRSIDLGPGSAVLVPPGIAHAYVHRRGVLHAHSIRFRDLPQRCDRWRQLTGGNACYLENCAQNAAAWEMAGIIQRVAAENGGVIDARVQILAQGILELMAEEFQTRRIVVTTDSPEYTNEILSYLQTHLHEKVTMEGMSQVFHLSASHLSRVFSQAYHTSPIHYLIYCRMQAARRKRDRDCPRAGKYAILDGTNRPRDSRRGTAHGETQACSAQPGAAEFGTAGAAVPLRRHREAGGGRDPGAGRGL